MGELYTFTALPYSSNVWIHTLKSIYICFYMKGLTSQSSSFISAAAKAATSAAVCCPPAAGVGARAGAKPAPAVGPAPAISATAFSAVALRVSPPSSPLPLVEPPALLARQEARWRRRGASWGQGAPLH